MESVVKSPKSPTVPAKTPFEKLKATVTYSKAPPPLYENAQAMLQITMSHALVLTAKHIVARLCRDLEPVTGQSENFFPLGEMTSEIMAEQVMHQIEAVRHCELAASHISKLDAGFEKRVRVSIMRGFNEAYTLLDSVGALALAGVRDEIDRTKDAILSHFSAADIAAGADSADEKARLISKLEMLWAGNQ